MPTPLTLRAGSTHGVPCRVVVDRDLLAGCDRARRGAVSEGATAELLPEVRRRPPGQVRTERDDPGGIDVGVHLVVVPLDVVEVDGVPEAGRLEQVTRVGP